MISLGYALSSEEHDAPTLIQHARRAEEVGFIFALISDHFHPWIAEQGQSPFVWTVIGGIAQATESLQLGTGVTCPLIRYHPAIIAQAAATSAQLMPRRFFLGVGTGENLNEHITGATWPPIDVRQAMLSEAIEVIRLLWDGGYQTYYGNFYTVEKARIFSLPDHLPPLLIAASGPISAQLAGEKGDGFIGTSPDKKVLQQFELSGGDGKPKYGQLTVCWARSEEAAAEIAHRWWPNTALPGQLSQELRLPQFFEQASALVSKDILAQSIPLGPDPQKYIKHIQQYAQAGYSHVYLHQIGPDQEGFFRFFAQELLPQIKSLNIDSAQPIKRHRGRPPKNAPRM